MSISGIGYHHYPNAATTNKYHKNKAGFYSYTNSIPEQSDRQTSQKEMQKAKYSVRDVELEREDKQSREDEEKTDTEIIVKPDGSKIMMTTVWIGGAKTTMSMEIAKPTGILEGDCGRTVKDSNMMVSDTSGVIESTPEK